VTVIDPYENCSPLKVCAAKLEVCSVYDAIIEEVIAESATFEAVKVPL
jgi:hypothetical protein